MLLSKRRMSLALDSSEGNPNKPARDMGGKKYREDRNLGASTVLQKQV